MKLFTRRELTIFLSVFFAVLLVSLTIAVSVSLVRRKASAPPADMQEEAAPSALSFDDFLIPESYKAPYYMDPAPWREPAERWDDKTASRFTQDVPAIILDIIRSENTARLLEGK